MSFKLDAYRLLLNCRDEAFEPSFDWHTKAYWLRQINRIARDLYSRAEKSTSPPLILTQEITIAEDSSGLSVHSLPANFGRLAGIFSLTWDRIERAHYRQFYEQLSRDPSYLITGKQIKFRFCGNGTKITLFYIPLFVPMAYGTVDAVSTQSQIHVGTIEAGLLDQREDIFNNAELAILEIDANGDPTNVEIQTITDWTPNIFTTSTFSLMPDDTMLWAIVPQILENYHDMISLGAVAQARDCVYAPAAAREFEIRLGQFDQDLDQRYPHSTPFIEGN